MISIMELAAELHVSRQALYNKLQRAGIAIDDVTQSKQGKKRLLSDEGATRIRNLFTSNDCNTLHQLQQLQLKRQQEELQQQLQQTVTQLQLQVEAMKTQILQCKQQIQSKDEMIEKITITMNRQEVTIEGLTNTVQAQAITTASQAKTIQILQEKTEHKTGKLAQIVARIGGKIESIKSKGNT